MNIKFNYLFILLIIFLSGCASKIPAPVDGELINKKEKEEKCPDIYNVKDKETLFSISLLCGFNYLDVAKANGLVKPYKLKKGDIIRLDLLRQSKITQPPEQTLKKEVETIPLNQDSRIIQDNEIIQEQRIIELVKITEPKVIREIYSQKTLKQTNAIVSNQEKLSNVWSSPTDGTISSNFDTAIGNKGIEIQGQLGQEIRAVAKGKVIYAGEDLKGYGKLVIVKHDDGLLTVYGNQNEILVKENQMVSAGQTLGTMGNSAVEEVKLIFEVRDGGKSIDPLKFLKDTIN